MLFPENLILIVSIKLFLSLLKNKLIKDIERVERGYLESDRNGKLNIRENLQFYFYQPVEIVPVFLEHQKH